MSVVFIGAKIRFDDQFSQFPKSNSEDMIPLWNSLKRTIPINSEVNKMFLNESDLIFSRNPPKKYAAGIKLINQRS
jgi:hypothetical protein